MGKKAFNAYLYAPFYSGRALTPQKNDYEIPVFLSFTDNVPFGDTLRVKGYSKLDIRYYTPFS